MTLERPPIIPITTTHSTADVSNHEAVHPTVSCPEIDTIKKTLNNNNSNTTTAMPSLPSPPLSPHQFPHPDHPHRTNSLPTVLIPITTIVTTADTIQQSTLISSICSSEEQVHSSSFELDSTARRTSTPPHTLSPTFTDGDCTIEEVDANQPMLPSQLRKRHESMKQQAKVKQPFIIEPSDNDDPGVNRSLIDNLAIPSIHPLNVLDDHSSEGSADIEHTDLIATSYHSGAMIRAKSHSMFESNHVSAAQRGLSSYISSLYKYQEMPIQDWINMKSKMEALELEISHVKRTNMLLNLELDKVNAHLARITANNDGEDLQEETNGWRKECEFLVQQVDWMHRQLQAAYASHMELTHPRYEAEATRELCVQVKDLTASLRMWQSAFQQAEEKYRRKCDGERVLKQNLREREAQLSSLVERLSGYESEFQKSLSNYEELMRLSTELELLEGNRDHTHFNAEDRAASSSLGKNQQGSNNISMPVVSIIRGVSDMPGALPKQDQSPTKSSETISPSAEATIVVDQLSVSILSWVALLATYMLS